MNYYNDNCPKSCAWLRELITAGEIPDGVVDGRSILDVQPADVAGFVQCHFFAGIGGWSLALKLAGWPEDRTVWTGSCPCQPYSAAGKGKGDADARNLWPAFFRLIKACKPECVIGEQVAAAIGHGWLDGVCTDLARENYTFGHIVLGAHSAGAPHIRQRIYWCGLALAQSEQPHGSGDARGGRGESSDSSNNGGVADATSPRCIGPLGDSEGKARDQARVLVSGEHGEDGGLADPNGGESGERELQRGGGLVQQPEDEAAGGMGDTHEPGPQGRVIGGDGSGERVAGPAGLGFWDDCELIPCADGKQRRVESKTQCLVERPAGGVVPGGDPGVEEAQNSGEARVMRLRGYGNSLCVPVAAEFIRAVMDLKGGENHAQEA